MNAQEAKVLRTGPLATLTDLKPNAVRDLAAALNILLADMFGLYVKTKNLHWHVSGPNFRDYHLLLDEQGEGIFATTGAIAERVSKIGGTTLRSVGHIGRPQRIEDNDADFVTPMDVLAELRDDNKQLTIRMREIHDLCEERRDVADVCARDALARTQAGDTECLPWLFHEDPANSQAGSTR
jgi:starvation-inducible DNA-binding protein